MKNKLRLYNLQILQNWEKNSVKKKRRKTHVLLENNQATGIYSQNKKTLTELPKLKRNKVLNTSDRTNMKIIPTWPKTSLPRFHQTARQNLTGEVG